MVNKKLRVMSKVSLIKTECNLDLEVPKFFCMFFVIAGYVITTSDCN